MLCNVRFRSYTEKAALHKVISRQNDTLLKDLLELKGTEQPVKAFVESRNVVKLDKEVISQKKDTLQLEIQDL